MDDKIRSATPDGHDLIYTLNVQRCYVKKWEVVMIFIETKHLLLRNLKPGDVQTMYDYRNNEICARYQRGQVQDYEGIAAMIERSKHDDISVDHAFMMAVILKKNYKMVGEIVVMPKDGTISLGCTFSYLHHRNGYAFESLCALINLLHERYPKWDFVVFIDPENQPSIGLVRKLGFEEMGYLPSKKSRVFGKWVTQRTKDEFEMAVRCWPWPMEFPRAVTRISRCIWRCVPGTPGR